MAPQPVIISCAITGAVHVPSLTPHLPITPAEIAEQAVAAAEAGAAIVHLHARDPETGQPSSDPDVFARFVPEIRDRTDAVINLTTGGGIGMSLEERLAAASRFEPELCSLNMGSMNVGMYPMIDRIKTFERDWERDFLESSKSWIFRNTFADVERIVEVMSGTGTRFEFECYDIGHLYTLSHFLERGVVDPPLFIQSVLGLLGGIGPTIEDLVHMRRTADRLFGNAYQWSVLGAGRDQMRLTTVAAIMDGNIRVGLEDSIFLGPGELAQSNADQVARSVRILGELSLEPATPDEARALLRLKGAQRTAI
jgi:uncharacterized protein (DUF849 family)